MKTWKGVSFLLLFGGGGSGGSDGDNGCSEILESKFVCMCFRIANKAFNCRRPLLSSFSEFHPIVHLFKSGPHIFCKTFLLLSIAYTIFVCIVLLCSAQCESNCIQIRFAMIRFVCLVLSPLPVSVHCLPIYSSFLFIESFVRSLFEWCAPA